MFIVVQATKSEETVALVSYKFDTLDEAKANYHGFLASSYANPGLTYILGAIIDEVGQSVMRESWFAPVEEESEA